MPRKITQDSNFAQSPNSSGSDDNYLLWMPSRLAGDLSIDAGAKMLFLFVSNFFRRDGYAICSDAWLVGKLGVEARMVQYYLNQLEEKGHIWRETWRNGMKLERRIWQSKDYLAYLEETGKTDEDFKKCFRNAMYCDSEPQCIAIADRNVLRYNPKEENIKERRERESTAQAPPSHPPPPIKSSPKKRAVTAKPAYPKPDLIERASWHPSCETFTRTFSKPLVGISDSMATLISSRYGSSILEAYIKRLAHWKVSRVEAADDAWKDKGLWAHTDEGRLKSWIEKDYADGKLDVKAEGVAPVVPVSEDRISQNSKSCNYIERKLQGQFSQRVYFQAGPTSACLIHMGKDYKRTYDYKAYDPKVLKETLLNDLQICFPNARDVLIPRGQPQGASIPGLSSLVAQATSRCQGQAGAA